MSVQFETVKENIPQGFTINARSSERNAVTFKLRKPRMQMAFGALGIPIFIVSLNVGFVLGGEDFAAMLVIGAIIFALCIFLVIAFYTQKIILNITPEFIQINKKNYDPRLRTY